MASSISLTFRNLGETVGRYNDAHSDAVLSLAFDRQSPTKLYTTSADGTASLYDVSGANEDDAFRDVLQRKL